jgi:hypothetical protein
MRREADCDLAGARSRIQQNRRVFGQPAGSCVEGGTVLLKLRHFQRKAHCYAGRADIVDY